MRDDIQGTTREFEHTGYCIRMDLSLQRLNFGLEQQQEWDARQDLIPAIERSPGEMVSAGALIQKAKQVDDGIMAALDLAAQHGLTSTTGKRRMLEDITRALCDDGAPLSDDLAFLFAAAQVGGGAPQIPRTFGAAVTRALEAFETNPLRSKPLGFYTWSPELTAIFRQDRLLQTEVEDHDAAMRIARAIASNTGTLRTYDLHVRNHRRFTNPPAPEFTDFRSRLEHMSGRLCFFPPSRSAEAEVATALYGNAAVPDGFDLMAELAERLASGALTLLPGKDDGFYAWQQWALAAFATTAKNAEASRFTFNEAYGDYQRSLFRAALALSRETQVKQLPVVYLGATRNAGVPREPTPLVVTPRATVEPFVTYYERRAVAYAFLRSAIAEAYGDSALSALHRYSPSGRTDRTLGEEIDDVEAILRGAALEARSELGMGDMDAPAAAQSSDRTRFRDFAGSVARDPDIGQDARMMVPVFYDVDRRQIKVWVFLGWRRKSLGVSYLKRPEVVRVNDSHGRDVTGKVQVTFRLTSRQILVPVACEVYVNRLLDRDEFRRLCDTHRSEAAILEALRS